MNEFDLVYLIGGLANVSLTLLAWIIDELSKEDWWTNKQ